QAGESLTRVACLARPPRTRQGPLAVAAGSSLAKPPRSGARISRRGTSRGHASGGVGMLSRARLANAQLLTVDCGDRRDDVHRRDADWRRRARSAPAGRTLPTPRPGVGVNPLQAGDNGQPGLGLMRINRDVDLGGLDGVHPPSLGETVAYLFLPDA